MRSALSWLLGAPALGLVCLWQLRPAFVVDRLGVADAWIGAAASLAEPVSEAEPPPATTAEPARLLLDLEHPQERLDERFLSVAIDTSQLVGGHFWSPSGRVEVGRGSQRVPPIDLQRPELLELARALGPAYLRVGGTEADHVYYAVGAARGSQRPAGYELTLDEPTWDGLQRFARAAGFELVFTVNAGPSSRDADGAWDSRNAEQLLDYTQARGQSVAVWELGNEVNGHWFIHGMLHQPTGKRYASDLWAFRRAVTSRFPGARIAGPASAFFPRLGEPLFDWFGFLPDVFEAGGGALDIVSWHYYPEQSRRCPVATRRAQPGQLLGPAALDEAAHWSARLAALRDRHAPGARLWLGETGPAQCGGEPGWSDRFASSLWWMDQLGSAARSGQAVVVRQTLLGSDYGLLDERTLEPRPDYYGSLLWRRLMGNTVLGASLSGGDRYLRAYAHCSARGNGVSLLLINLSPERSAQVVLEGAPPESIRYRLSAPALDSRELYLNGRALARDPSHLPELSGERDESMRELLSVAPASYSFYELPSLSAPACRAGLWGRLEEGQTRLGQD